MFQNPETVLCKCFICKEQNPELDGKFVSIITFRKYRKKESSQNIDTIIQNDISLNYLECFSSNNSYPNLNTKKRQVFLTYTSRTTPVWPELAWPVLG